MCMECLKKLNRYVVYFIQAKGKPLAPIKIGVTNNLQRRLDTLQTGADETLVVLGAQRFRTRQAMFDRETQLHHKFRASRLRPDGEWFRWTVELQWYMLWHVYTLKQVVMFLLKQLFTGVLYAGVHY